MAENITGMESSNWGGKVQSKVPSAFRRMRAGCLPKKTLVSIGSRRGSMEGLVTWEAFPVAEGIGLLVALVQRKQILPDVLT